jgi:hypothetical protein
VVGSFEKRKEGFPFIASDNFSRYCFFHMKNPFGNESLINYEYCLNCIHVIMLNHAVTEKNYTYKEYLPSEQVGPVYDVISQSHAYEFHCWTQIPRLAQML